MKTNNSEIIKKAVVPIAGLGTRFLPLSKILPKELFPLVDKPVLQYIIDEARDSGIKQLVFVNRPDKKVTFDFIKKYFKRTPVLEKILKARGKNLLLEDLKNMELTAKEISFSQVLQKNPLGDGHAVLQAKKIVNKEPFAVLFGDDIVESKKPCLLQLKEIFQKYHKPVIALCRIPEKNLHSYGIVKVEKISDRTYKIKDIVEKPAPGTAPSNLAIVGKYILTPDIFNFLKEKKGLPHGEIILANALKDLINSGNEVIGYEFEGKWLECGNKPAYLKTNFYLSLNHPQFGKELKEFIKDIEQ